MVIALLMTGLLACHKVGTGLPVYNEPKLPDCWVDDGKVIRNDCVSPGQRWDLADKVLELRLYFRELNGAAKEME